MSCNFGNHISTILHTSIGTYHTFFSYEQLIFRRKTLVVKWKSQRACVCDRGVARISRMGVLECLSHTHFWQTNFIAYINLLSNSFFDKNPEFAINLFTVPRPIRFQVFSDDHYNIRENKA